MPTFEFAAGFMACGLLITLYLLNKAIGILRDFLSVLKKFIEDE